MDTGGGSNISFIPTDDQPPGLLTVQGFQGTAQYPGKPGQNGPVCHVEKVSEASAIGAAKTLYRGDIGNHRQCPCPVVLLLIRLGTVPGANGSHRLPEIIDMPVFRFTTPAMPADTRPYTAGAECTAHVNVIARLDADTMPAPYQDISA